MKYISVLFKEFLYISYFLLELIFFVVIPLVLINLDFSLIYVFISTFLLLIFLFLNKPLIRKLDKDLSFAKPILTEYGFNRFKAKNNFFVSKITTIVLYILSIILYLIF